MVSTETIDYHHLFLDLPFFPLNESSSDYNLQALLNNQKQQNSVDQPTCPDQIGHQFQSFVSFGPNLEQGYENLSNPLMESENFQGQALSTPENSFLFNNGDLENKNQRCTLDPSAMEEAQTPFKVGRYNPVERQERISKYRAKRNQRNFNKTIKYACRKTLADNRPRIRGRFARNDEVVKIPKASCSTRDEDEDDFRALHEVEDDETMSRGDFMNSFIENRFQYHHNCF